jgi:hypothetical protein
MNGSSGKRIPERLCDCFDRLSGMEALVPRMSREIHWLLALPPDPLASSLFFPYDFLMF